MGGARQGRINYAAWNDADGTGATEDAASCRPARAERPVLVLKRVPTTRRAAGLAAGGVAAYLAVLLWVDRFADVWGQVALGAITWLALLAACSRLSPLRRTQALLVVGAATCGEITGSIVWGVYTYRLENLPAFVPPAHGLVYLGGLALATALRGRERILVGVALAGVLGWGLAGVTLLPRADVGGFVGALLLGAFLLRGRARAAYAGVFLVVAALELYGTALGTWTWAGMIPGTAVPNGNPPSGVAAGYVFFDIVALALAPRVLSLVQSVKRQPKRTLAPDRSAPAEA